MTDVSKTNDGWTEEQARKIGEATEESVRESGADVGATPRAESTLIEDSERVDKVTTPPSKNRATTPKRGTPNKP